MRKGICCLTVALYINVLFVYSQANAIMEDMCGTYKLYPIPEKEVTMPPLGYEPVFINHVGRHGSRYPVSEESLKLIQEELNKQKSFDNLNADGEKLLININHIIDRCQNNWGGLSSIGAEEQRGIAQRFKAAYGQDLFRKVRCWIDPQKRCVESYESFFKGLSEVLPFQPVIDETKMVRQNNILNFFVYNQSYDKYKKSGNWISEYKLYESEQLEKINLLNRYVKDTKEVNVHIQQSFDLALFNVWAIAPNISLPYSERPELASDEIYHFWLVQNARQYLEKGPSPIAGGIQQNISIPLLKQFIDTSEENLKTKNYGGFFRFAHAETIIPFAALLKIPEASEATSVTSDIAEVWKDYIVSPMAANIIWVFYQNKKGNVLIKMLLNEKEVEFPIPTDNFPFYEWPKVRRYYQDMYSL